MKRMILVIIVLCSAGLGLFLWQTNNNAPNRNYQYYFQWCSKKLTALDIDAEFTNKTCDCIAAKIIDDYPDPRKLTKDGLEPIVFLCLLLDMSPRAAYDDL